MLVDAFVCMYTCLCIWLLYVIINQQTLSDNKHLLHF